MKRRFKWWARSSRNFFCFGRPAARGVSSLVRDHIPNAVPTKLQLHQHQILNPLCPAGDQTCVPVLPRCHQSHCTSTGTPRISFLFFYFIYLFIYFVFLGPHPGHMEVPNRGWIRATAASLSHNHSNARSKQHLWPTPHLTATPDSLPIDGGQGLNHCSHGY